MRDPILGAGVQNKFLVSDFFGTELTGFFKAFVLVMVIGRTLFSGALSAQAYEASPARESYTEVRGGENSEELSREAEALVDSLRRISRWSDSQSVWESLRKFLPQIRRVLISG